jgi:aminoglycoside phosphotransferase (APT) family kinase protein
MPFYPPDQYPVWKSLLASGTVDEGFAGVLGGALARIHAATAHRADVAAQFANDAQYHALRLDPYLLYTADRHPDVASRIRTIAGDVRRARIALMHGDFSPKNILCGPESPMILDAETACYGDPAFDVAFCLNHLALKCVWHPEFRGGYLRSFSAFRDRYLANVTWEDAAGLDKRTAPLLAALMLARIDGKSPVEYLTRDRERNFVRGAALTFLREDMSLGEMLAAWRTKLEAEFEN